MPIVLTLNITFGIGESFSTIFLILFLLSICVFIYRISKYVRNKNFKYAIASLSILLILHSVIFPFIYTLMLKNNPASFEFKTTIYTNRKQIVLDEWINDSQSLPHEIKDLENIKLSNSIILNKQLKEFKNLTFTKSHIIYMDVNLSMPNRNPIATIYIFDKKGILKKKLDKSGGYTELDSVKFGSIINHNINYLKNELQYYKVKKAELDRNNFWTFATILPYSISSIFTGNMSPITPTANIFYSFHYFIIYCIGIGVFLHFLILNINFLIKNRKP
jgi:cbb3-type cytochrome oxidase subunit 3